MQLSDTPSPPGWLDEDARAEWHELAADRSFPKSQLPPLAAYCFTLAMWRRARAVLEAVEHEGTASWVSADGDQHPHPVFAVEARLATELNELCEALDLQPRGRPARKPTRILFLDEGAQSGDD